MGFLNANNHAVVTTLDENFLELTTAFLILQSVDGEDLFLVNRCQCQGIGNGSELLLELTLVKQDEHTGVADDGILDNLVARDVLNVLSYHTDGCPVLSGQLKDNELLIEVLLVLLACDLEGIHGDRMLLGIGDIDASLDLTKYLIAVADIDNDNIGVLLEELAHNGIHEEASGWA